MKCDKWHVMNRFPNAKLQTRFYSLERLVRYRIVLAHVHGKKAQLTGWYRDEWAAWKAARKKLNLREAAH